MGSEQRTPVLVLCDPERAGDLAPFFADLQQSRRFDVDVTSDPDRLLRLDGVAVLFAHRSHSSINAEQARAVARFTHNGGAVITVGATLPYWAAHQTIAELSGWTPNGRTMRTELDIAHADDGVTFRVNDMFHLLPGAPDDAAPMLLTTWQFTQQVVAYRRPVGAGSFTYIGLGHDRDVYANDGVRRALRRAVDVHSTSRRVRSLVGVGIIGFGALGPAHAATLDAVADLRLAAVCDRDPARRERVQALGAVAVASSADLFALDDVDVVLVATPPVTHAAIVLEALDAGKHVVCEKPFALRAADCDRMIASAAERDLTLTVFQNRRWDPDFVALQRVVRSGAIGDLFLMESFVGAHAHPCHYWHSHQEISGGAVYDWGSHYVDWILQLFDRPVVSVRAHEVKRVWHDVTNADHVGVDIGFDGGAVASFIQSDIAAARKPKWYVLGTKGAVIGDWRMQTRTERSIDGEIEDIAVLPTDLPARVAVHRPDGDGGAHVESLALPRRDPGAFWRNLAGHLLHGEPLAVPAHQARRVVAVLEASTASAARGGAVIELRI